MTPKLRVSRSTRQLANGTKVTTTKLVPRAVQEWEVQAEAVRQIKLIPGYGDEAGPGVTFTFAGDFNSARRSPQQSVIAKATGIKAGEQDIRAYALGANVLLVELKGPKTPISADQHKRHALHRHLGFRVEVVRGKTVEQGAADVVALFKEWLTGLGLLTVPSAANDNDGRKVA